MQTGINIALVLFGALCAWITFDTRRALRFIVDNVPRPRWTPERFVINPDRRLWIWFYRIDCAVVLAGIVYMLATGWRFVPQ